MKLLISMLLLFSALSSFAHTFISLSNVKGEVLINGTFYPISTNGNGDRFETPSLINFAGKNYDIITSASSYHVSAEVVADGRLTMVTLHSLRKENSWSWLRNTVFNSAESICTSSSDYFFTVTNRPVDSGYAFFGNCLN